MNRKSIAESPWSWLAMARRRLRWVFLYSIRGGWIGAAALAFQLLAPDASLAQAKRVVIVKIDGLSSAVIDRFVAEKDPRSGKSRLPWIHYLFYEKGARVKNFYTRGITLSAPSWSILDTGQHQQIKGNVEFDRYSLYIYDYVNFISFYLDNAKKERVDSPGVEVLDDLRIPILSDGFPYAEQFPTFKIFQRGGRWSLVKQIPLNWGKSQSPGEILGEWVSGLDIQNAFREQLEREIVIKLNDPTITYFDYATEEFDHITHRVRESQSHFAALKKIDETIGRYWSAIQKSPLAKETALIVVSDHGSNTDEKIYSQGFNLVSDLSAKEGGAHHVVTKRTPLRDYSIKAILPRSLISTASPESLYLKGKNSDYPTATLDFDGNERASLHLRDSDLNVLQILFQQLAGKSLSPELRRAATAAFFQTIEGRRSGWQQTVQELEEELVDLRRAINRERALYIAQSRKWTRRETEAGLNKEVLRHRARANAWEEYATGYRSYLAALKNLLSLSPKSFAPEQLRIEEIIPPRSMGDRNTIYQLQNYVIGPAPEGLSLRTDGSLDWQKSFLRLNYFAHFASLAVRNRVQEGMSNRPIDFLVASVPITSLAPTLSEDEMPHEDAIWLYGSEEKQGLILARKDERGKLSLRYLPISHLRQEASGKITFQRQDWQPGFPLKIFEDPELVIASDTRRQWLNGWHSEFEWLAAVHKTDYSNGIIGLHEHCSRHLPLAADLEMEPQGFEEKLLQRFFLRQRRLVETDFLILANNHWNFDVRGFNPGGNHGSFFRVSTLSTFMAVGGEEAGIATGKVVTAPYDNLSFVPTVLAIMGRPAVAKRKSQASLDQPTTLPGRVIWELMKRPGATEATGNH